MRRTAIHRLCHGCRIALLGLVFFVTPAWGMPPLPASVIGRLSADQFSEREKAQAEVLLWARQDAAAAKDLLYDLSRTHGEPEVRRRCLSVLRVLGEEAF